MEYGTKEHAASVVESLERIYPDAECALKYEGDGWKLLVMARLSAQCTDKRVNLTAKELFATYPTPRDLADADISDVEAIVRPCGLYRVKAKDIIAESRMLCDDFYGKLPQTMDELISFPGVGRKIANLLLGDLFGLPAVVVDTHCIRLSGRLGLVPEGVRTPEKIERILTELIEPEKQSDFCHRIVNLGRDHCTARGQKCADCPMWELCREANN